MLSVWAAADRTVRAVYYLQAEADEACYLPQVETDEGYMVWHGEVV